MNLYVRGIWILCIGVWWYVAFVFGEPTIVVDPITKTIRVVDNTWSSTTLTGAVDDEWVDDVVWDIWDTSSISIEEEDYFVNDDQVTDSVIDNNNTTSETHDPVIEFDVALSWMYTNGLTTYNTVDGYMPFNNLTREQFAKMVRQFYVAMGYDTSTKNTACNFVDIENADPTLIPHINETCRLGIFRWSRGRFMPFNQITRAEVMAVLLRIYNQERLDETQNPWWLDYYQQGQELGITEETIQDNMNQPANRYTIAMYMWRLRNIIIEERRDTTTIPWSVERDELNNLIPGVGTDTIAIDRDAVVSEAIYSMYEDDMIGFDQWDDVLLYQTITRADVARILDRFGQLYVSDYVVDDISSACDFGDIRDLDRIIQQSIKHLCAMNVMKWDSVSGNFFPGQVLTKAQFVTTVVRMIDGVLDETSTPWRENYYQRALSWRLISSQDRASFEREMTMIEVVWFVHKLKIHALLGSVTTTNNLLTNEFVRVIENSDGDIKAYIDSNFLRDIDSRVGYITLDTDNRYKVVRDHIEEYSNARLSRYGTLYDPITDEVEGSVWFITQKGHVIQGTIRLMDIDQYYTITPDENSYYRYTIVKASRD